MTKKKDTTLPDALGIGTVKHTFTHPREDSRTLEIEIIPVGAMEHQRWLAIPEIQDQLRQFNGLINLFVSMIYERRVDFSLTKEDIADFFALADLETLVAYCQFMMTGVLPDPK